MSLKILNLKDILMLCFIKEVMRHNMKRVQGKLHRIGTYDVRKTSLSYFDNKRYILGDGINTSAYFYRDIRNQ